MHVSFFLAYGGWTWRFSDVKEGVGSKVKWNATTYTPSLSPITVTILELGFHMIKPKDLNCMWINNAIEPIKQIDLRIFLDQALHIRIYVPIHTNINLINYMSKHLLLPVPLKEYSPSYPLWQWIFFVYLLFHLCCHNILNTTMYAWNEM